MQCISHRSNFIVLIYFHYATTMTLVIQQFLGSICHIVEIIDVRKWWDPLICQVSYVISTLKRAWEPWEHCGEP